MKKFGFGRKGDDAGDDDPSRSALFGGRKKGSPAPGGDNPYAQAGPAEDPYAASSQSARPSPVGLPSGPRRGQSAGSNYSQPPPPYGSVDAQPARGPNPGYGSDRYGASGGYGDNRYDSGGGYGASRYGSGGGGASRGPGGYGGLGRSDSNDADPQRDQLFAGAQQRQQQRQPEPSAPGGAAGGSGNDPPGQSGADDTYGGYGMDRPLTEEEMEEKEVKNVKQQITDTRQESINSLNRSIALAHQAADTGVNTMNILARDEERLINTEKRLDDAANYNQIGADRAKKLKHLNRSMFAVHVNNPFTAGRRQAEYENGVLESHRSERDQRDATRKNAWDATAGVDKSFREMSMRDGGGSQGGHEAAQRDRKKDKYKFVDDDDDEYNDQADEDESTIGRQMGELGDAVGMLNRVAKAQTSTVGRQIVSADRINEKTDKVDDGVRVNRARLDRIR